MPLKKLSIITVVFISSLVLGCVHNRRQECRQQAYNILKQIAAVSVDQVADDPADADVTTIDIPALESALSMQVKVSTYGIEKKGKRWVSVEFWRNERQVASWYPGCSKYEWKEGKLLLYYELGEGYPAIKIYKNGQPCYTQFG